MTVAGSSQLGMEDDVNTSPREEEEVLKEEFTKISLREEEFAKISPREEEDVETSPREAEEVAETSQRES